MKELLVTQELRSGESHYNASWKEGKTEHSIMFVFYAENFITYSNDTIAVAALADAVRMVKSGELVFHEWKSPLHYLSDMQRGIV